MVKMVDPSWVAERLGSPEFQVLDPGGRMKYLRGHLKGSVNLPVTRLLDADARLLPPEQLATIFGDAGVDDATAAVLYDSYDGQRGAFMAWVLEYLGHPDVHLMDTFFRGWTAQDREIFYRPVEPVARTFTGRVVPAVRATLEEIKRKDTARLLDLRSAGEFSGDADLDARPGHIPGAKNIAWLQLLGDNHRFLLPAKDMRAALASAGIETGDSVIAYCRVGMRAGVGYIALQQLGYDVRLYDGSYSEWAKAGLPVETTT